MFTPIGRILPEALKKSGIERHVARARLLDVFIETARGLLPEAQHGHVRALHLKNGTLTVACKSSGAAFALRAKEDVLMKALRAGGDGASVERLRFMLAPWR